MASLSSAKDLGGIGSILALIPGINIVGWILILIALKDISEITQDDSVFDNALIGAITAIVGAVSLVVLPFVIFDLRLGFYTELFSFLAILELVAVVSTLFLKKAYDKVAVHLKVGSFATTGLLFLIGAITLIVFVGILILFIALIFQIVAYFSIQVMPSMPYPGYQPQPMYPGAPSPQPTLPSPAQFAPTSVTAQQPVAPEFKFCFKCGTKLPASAVYCTSCGTKQ